VSSLDKGVVMNSLAVVIRAEITFHDEMSLLQSKASWFLILLLSRAALMRYDKLCETLVKTPEATEQCRRRAVKEDLDGSQEIDCCGRVLHLYARAQSRTKRFNLKN
jgi:hypothetical protein